MHRRRIAGGAMLMTVLSTSRETTCSRALVLRTPTKLCGNEAYDRQNNDDHDDADPDAGFEDRADRFACRHGQRQRRDYDQSQKTR